jgi:hypothetical protein
MDYFTQPPSPNRDEITLLPALPTPNSSVPQQTGSRRSSALDPQGRPHTPLRPSSIRIRRLPSTPQVPQINVEDTDHAKLSGHGEQVGRRRSSSEPQRMHLSAGPPYELVRQRTGVSHAPSGSYMPAVREEVAEPQAGSLQVPELHTSVPGRMRRASTSARSALGLERVGSKLHPSVTQSSSDYEDGVVDLLDVVGSWTPLLKEQI